MQFHLDPPEARTTGEPHSSSAVQCDRDEDGVGLDEPCAVLLGAEGTGLPPHLLAAADVRLTIPMQPPVESLNVAVAAGIILYEARRQRTAPGGGP